MNPQRDMQFLALLVHRGHLPREKAEGLVPQMKAGRSLDELLNEEIGWDEKVVRKLRRTRAGEIPEIPGYEVLGKIGSGGTAEVFRVRESKTGRPLALKVLNPVSTSNLATRNAFVAEARLLQKLEHRGLVRGYGVAKSGQTYFARMELVEGKTLLELLDAGESFAETVALQVALEVAEVLLYLTDQHVVHRDVKPGNIMLSGNGHVKLIDLGFAADAGAGPNREGQAVGTVAYLSPEQAMGGAGADLRSDVYSLGVTLFHLVVGRLPFESSDDREVLRMQVMQSLSSPELKSRGLSPHLHYFVEKMMAKDAAVRYQSWKELVDDIRAQLEGREHLDFESAVRKRNPRFRGGQPPGKRR